MANKNTVVVNCNCTQKSRGGGISKSREWNAYVTRLPVKECNCSDQDNYSSSLAIDLGPGTGGLLTDNVL